MQMILCRDVYASHRNEGVQWVQKWVKLLIEIHVENCVVCNWQYAKLWLMTMIWGVKTVSTKRYRYRFGSDNVGLIELQHPRTPKYTQSNLRDHSNKGNVRCTTTKLANLSSAKNWKSFRLSYNPGSENTFPCFNECSAVTIYVHIGQWVTFFVAKEYQCYASAALNSVTSINDAVLWNLWTGHLQVNQEKCASSIPFNLIINHLEIWMFFL